MNFKILAQTLATPKVISLVQKDESLDKCLWCFGSGSLEHCLFLCKCVDKMRCKIERDNKCLLTPWS